MSVANPPIIVTSTYNPAFFETSSDSISPAQANALYLKKTTADTATALETFNAGIKTPNLNPITAASSLFIGDSSSTGNIAIKGTDGASGILAICDGPTTSTAINIGSNACITKIRGLQILDAAAASTLDIAASQTTGVLNIGCGSRLITVPGNGVINIGTGSGAVVNPINIGGASSTTALNGTTTIANLAIDAVQRGSSGTLLLGTSATSTAITVGSTSKAITIGPLIISADPNLTLNNVSATAEIYIGNTQVSPVGGISIGTGSGRSSNIAIGSTNASVISIGGTGLTTVGSGGLTVNGTTTCSGGLTMGNGKNIILQSATGYVTPSLNTQLGYLSTASIPASTLISGTATEQATTGTLQLGTYMVLGYLSVTYGAVTSSMFVWITEDNTIAYTSRKTETINQTVALSNYATNLSYIATNTTGPFKLIAQSSTTGATVVQGNIWAVRIA
jgi:hypothetical protein